MVLISCPTARYFNQLIQNVLAANQNRFNPDSNDTYNCYLGAGLVEHRDKHLELIRLSSQQSSSLFRLSYANLFSTSLNPYQVFRLSKILMYGYFFAIWSPRFLLKFSFRKIQNPHLAFRFWEKRTPGVGF